MKTAKHCLIYPNAGKIGISGSPGERTDGRATFNDQVEAQIPVLCCAQYIVEGRKGAGDSSIDGARVHDEF